ncbi:MAG: DUF4026 domain-containing protein [Phycisphaeraceae bacterium]|nr:DUF4026 domain-containing protein [Phycisphaeraceae bacterium]MBX3367641.1 DUF4026 domain-containing protein [Phycisphaeraceae bacterium]
MSGFDQAFPSVGGVLWRGRELSIDDIGAVEKRGVRIQPGRIKPGASEPHDLRWSLHLTHPRWGDADVGMFLVPALPPMHIIDLTPGTTSQDRELLAACTGSLTVRCPASTQRVLRDRKNMLRFVHAIAETIAAAPGVSGTIGADHGSEQFWSLDALRDEMAHDADLDVQHLFIIHAVEGKKPGTSDWVHTHGLDKVGGFDFDILAPSREMLGAMGTATRALAFSVIEGEVRPDTARHTFAYPDGEVRFIPVGEFMRDAAQEHRALRDLSENHAENRSVICEPASEGKSVRAMLSKLGGSRPRPALAFQRKESDGMVFAFSTKASELMAARAVATLPLLRGFMEEFRDLINPGPDLQGLGVLMKMGYKVDDADSDTDREHMWFEVHGVGERTVDATLLNQPHGIAAMNQGDRGEHPIELLTEWSIMTPGGTITPQSLGHIRAIRHNKDKLLAFLRGG